MQIHPHDIEGAVNQIDAARHSVICSAGVLQEDPNSKMTFMLGENLVFMAKVLAAFHHAFDCSIDPRSLSENERELQDWAASYDRSFANSLAIYRKHEGASLLN